MRNAKIEMYDDTILTLTNARHVHELRKNLISLGVLDSEGYKFIGKKGVLKVSEGDQKSKIMKEEKIKNIYRLKGSTHVS